MAAKSAKIEIFSPWHRILLYYPVGQEVRSNTHFHFLQKSKMAAKSGEN